MRATDEEYADQLAQLSPRGAVWREDAAPIFRGLLRAIGAALARVHNRALALLDEAIPTTTRELLPDWERIAGLPDPCMPAPQTLQERRARLAQRLAARRSLSIPDIIAEAAALGFTITVTEFRPFRVGDPVGRPLCGEDWRFTWQVNAPLDMFVYFRAGESAVGEPLRAWGNDSLECVLERIKPAHTRIIFTYGS